MQIKTMLRFHLIFLKMDIIKNTTTNVGQNLGLKMNPPILLERMLISIIRMENNMEAPQKTKSRTAI
jgi:hypothetical protein